MNQLIASSTMIGVVISIIGYEIGLQIKKRYPYAICNPLLIAILFILMVMGTLQIDFESYEGSAKYLSYLLTPATVCLAIPLYQQLQVLKKHLLAVVVSVLTGVVTGLTSVYLLSYLFRLTHEQYVTLLPKSITTAIGIGIAEELGGIVPITVGVIIITGIFGNILGEWLCKRCGITHPVSKGIAMGSASHAIGTAKAMEMGEIEGAMSSVALVVTGLFTTIGASIFAQLL